MSKRRVRYFGFVVKLGRSEFWMSFYTIKPFVWFGRERVLTDPRGVGFRMEWE